MSGWNLPPGCTNADIERAQQGDDEPEREDIPFELYEGERKDDPAHDADEHDDERIRRDFIFDEPEEF